MSTEDPPLDNAATEEERQRRQREHEEAMEQLLLAQEQQQQQEEDEQAEAARLAAFVDEFEDELGQAMEGRFGPRGDNEIHANNNNNGNNDNIPPPPPLAPPPPSPPQASWLSKLSYTQTSLGAALGLLIYALRTRHQWYLALVYISSSKWAYIVLGNALVATCVGCFRWVCSLFLGGLRLHEREGLGDFFRWNVAESCLALTMFRSELTVPTGVLFLLLVLAKCLHWVADLREQHLRVTEESITMINNPGGWLDGWPRLQWPHTKLWVLLVLLQVGDILAVQWCGQDILANGASVSILFGFEAAILLVSAWNNLVLWHLHALDGCMHYLHEHTSPQNRMHRWIHPWKEHKATFMFAVEVQAQAAKFLFYVTFFAIVLTYYGMPINLFREVYLSFQALKQRLVAFAKYRRLMASMNRFQNVTEEELEQAGSDCIICRDDMTISDSKKLPGCGHVFHKSCLREWLVQQQSCPTCRGDIAAMEHQAEVDQARRMLADVRAAAMDEAAQEAEERREAREEAEQQEQADTSPADAAIAGNRGQSPSAIAPPAVQSPSTPAVQQISKRVRIGATGVIPDQAQQQQLQQSPFPALYRVVKDTGAPVYGSDDTGVIHMSNVLRTVPFGVVVLCQELCWRQNFGFMMRLPDGWVQEDTVVRVRTLASLKQQQQGKAQQQQQQQRLKAE